MIDQNKLQFIKLNTAAYTAGPRDAEARAVFADYAAETLPTLVAEVERLRKIANIAIRLVDNAELYDEDEGDCMVCGAEVNSDGNYCHVTGCPVYLLENAVEDYRAAQ